MPNPVLYHSPASTPSWAVRMLAARIGLPLDCTIVNLLEGEHKNPDYVKINPMATIPTIKDGDFYISESHTIMKYLLEKYGQQHLEELYPSELQSRARVDQALYFDTGVAFIRVKLIALPAVFEDQDSISPKLHEEVESVYNITEQYLQRHKYAAADHFTLADYSLGGTVLSLQQFVPIDAKRFPRVLEWLELLRQDKEFNEIAVPGAQILGDAVRACMERNRPVETLAHPVLYHNLYSPPSWALRMFAVYVGLTLDEKSVDMLNSEHKTAPYLEINAMGTVPCLQDGPFNISESHTIEKYLLYKYRPEFIEELYPEDLEARALIDQAIEFDTGVAFIRVKNIALPTFLLGQKSISPFLVSQVEDVYGIMERYLARHTYAAADKFTLADFNLGCTFLTLDEFIPYNSDNYPRVSAWMAKLMGMQVFKDIALPGKIGLGKAVRLYFQKNIAAGAEDAAARAYVLG